MGWYRVTKKINGPLYDYWQRTERHGKSVKTFNKYIGPAGQTGRLTQLVVNNKATNLRVVECDGMSVSGRPTGKKVYHLEGDIPYSHPELWRDKSPPPAVMEFETKREAINVMKTAQRLKPPAAESELDDGCIIPNCLDDAYEDALCKLHSEDTGGMHTEPSDDPVFEPLVLSSPDNSSSVDILRRL